MRAATLQDWITVQAYSASDLPQSVKAFTQPQPGWLDMSSFADATFWIDVTQVVANSGVSVQLVLQSSPTLDESYFQPVTPPITLASSPTPLVVKTVRTPTIVPLARFLRWQLQVSPSGTTGTWGATFRVRVAGSLERFFVPTDLPGCLLWVRADLGITPNGSNVSGWADQSGNGNNFSQTNTAAQPLYVQNAMNGLPALRGNGTSYEMVTSTSPTLGASASLFVACQPLQAAQNAYARLMEQRNDLSYYLGFEGSGQTYKLIVHDAISPFGSAYGGSVTVYANTIVSGVYNQYTGKGTLYVNGTQPNPGQDTFAAPSATSAPIHIMRDWQDAFTTWFNGYFGEAIIYTRALGANEMNLVHRYLGNRYAVASML